MAEITREELLARYAAGKRDFRGLDLTRMNWRGVSDLRECLLDSFGLNGCNFRGANFSFADFSKTSLRNCDFRDTICFRN